LKYLSENLTKDFGQGFTIANLRNMRQFYQIFPIRYTLRSELNWTQYRSLMRIADKKNADCKVILIKNKKDKEKLLKELVR